MLCRQMHICLLILRPRWAQCTSMPLMHRYVVPHCKAHRCLTSSMLCAAGCSNFKLATSLQPCLVVVLQHISFTLQSNSSTNWFKGHYQNPNTYFQLPLQMAAERETARHLANGESSFVQQPVGSTADMTDCIKSGKRQEAFLMCICTVYN